MVIVSASGNKEEQTITIRYQKDFDEVKLSRYLKSLHISKQEDSPKFSVEDHLPFYEAPSPDFTGEITLSYQKS